MPACSLPAFHLMAKPGGSRCNLSCQYCFYSGKGELYPGSRFRMSDEVLEEYIKADHRGTLHTGSNLRMAGW